MPRVIRPQGGYLRITHHTNLPTPKGSHYQPSILQKILLIKLHPLSPQKSPQLIRKSKFLMMLLLPQNIILHHLKFLLTIRKHSIRPSPSTKLRILLIMTLYIIAQRVLQHTHKIRHCNRGCISNKICI